MHASQTLACLQAGKHVQVEIPLCDVLKEGEAVVEAQRKTGLVAMCGHTRRFNPSHQWVRRRIVADEFHIQQMDVQTYFFRRTNMNASASPAAGPTTCSGTTPPTPWTCSPTRRRAPS